MKYIIFAGLFFIAAIFSAIFYFKSSANASPDDYTITHIQLIEYDANSIQKIATYQITGIKNQTDTLIDYIIINGQSNQSIKCPYKVNDHYRK